MPAESANLFTDVSPPATVSVAPRAVPFTYAVIVFAVVSTTSLTLFQPSCIAAAAIVFVYFPRVTVVSAFLTSNSTVTGDFDEALAKSALTAPFT